MNEFKWGILDAQGDRYFAHNWDGSLASNPSKLLVAPASLIKLSNGLYKPAGLIEPEDHLWQCIASREKLTGATVESVKEVLIEDKDLITSDQDPVHKNTLVPRLFAPSLEEAKKIPDRDMFPNRDRSYRFWFWDTYYRYSGSQYELYIDTDQSVAARSPKLSLHLEVRNRAHSMVEITLKTPWPVGIVVGHSIFCSHLKEEETNDD